MEKSKIGVIHGRFQGLHMGHMEYLMAGLNRCEFLYIGITNPDPKLSAEDVHDLKRSSDDANPFTYYERAMMIRDALLEAGINRNRFETVPFPINFPELIHCYAPLSATFFVTIYDQWGQHKLDTLNQLGVKTDLMWTRTMDERFSTGQEVRKLIKAGESWTQLVPPAVAHYIKNNQLDKRIKG